MGKTLTRALFILFKVSFRFIPSACSKDDHDDDVNNDPFLAIENEVLTFVNEYLSDIGKPTLPSNALVREQARQNSSNMASGRMPYGYDGVLNRIITINASISGSSATEDVAMGSSSARAAVTVCLNPAGHKANI